MNATKECGVLECYHLWPCETVTRRMFDEMPKRNVVSYTTMIDGYAKASDMVSARFLFE